MINKTWSRKFLAIFAAAAVLSVYSMLTLATPEHDQVSCPWSALSVNGQKARPRTIFSVARSLPRRMQRRRKPGKLGRVELSANTSLR